MRALASPRLIAFGVFAVLGGSGLVACPSSGPSRPPPAEVPFEVSSAPATVEHLGPDNDDASTSNAGPTPIEHVEEADAGAGAAGAVGGDAGIAFECPGGKVAPPDLDLVAETARGTPDGGALALSQARITISNRSGVPRDVRVVAGERLVARPTLKKGWDAPTSLAIEAARMEESSGGIPQVHLLVPANGTAHVVVDFDSVSFPERGRRALRFQLEIDGRRACIEEPVSR